MYSLHAQLPVRWSDRPCSLSTTIECFYHSLSKMLPLRLAIHVFSLPMYFHAFVLLIIAINVLKGKKIKVITKDFLYSRICTMHTMYDTLIISNFVFFIYSSTVKNLCENECNVKHGCHQSTCQIETPVKCITML